MKEYMALKFTWAEVSGILEQAVERMLGQPLLCEARAEDDLYWVLCFNGSRLTRKEIDTLCDYVDADGDMRIESEPPEQADTANSIGMRLALALLKKQLKVKAEAQLITEYDLWLIGVEKE